MLLQVPYVVIKASPPSAHPYVDVVLSSLPVLIAVGGGLWATYKYLRDKRDIFDKELRDRRDSLDKELRDRGDALNKELALKAQANETARIESQKPFSAKQQEVYFDLLGTTSLIANRTTDPNADPERAKAIEHFWVLFWGALPVVANKDVAAEADIFSVALKNPMDFVPLRNASMDLARACRTALGEAWSIGLEQFAKSEAATAMELPEVSELYKYSGPKAV
jgi:hypothetical protein